MPGTELEKNLIPAVAWSSAILPVLDKGHSLKMPFSGLSMYPLLVGGRDQVLIESAAGKKLKRGDIILFVRDDGTHVMHRIHHVKEDAYYMVGDAQTWVEGPVPADHVLAVVTTIFRKDGIIPCKRYDYIIISRLWLLLRPLRPIIIASVRGLRRFLQK